MCIRDSTYVDDIPVYQVDDILVLRTVRLHVVAVLAHEYVRDITRTWYMYVCFALKNS